jgi:hypothetical protein
VRPAAIQSGFGRVSSLLGQWDLSNSLTALLADLVDNFFGIALGLDNQLLPLQLLESCRSPILMQLQVTKHG